MKANKKDFDTFNGGQNQCIYIIKDILSGVLKVSK